MKRCDMSRKNLCYTSFVISIVFFIVSIGLICFASAFGPGSERGITEDRTHHIQQRKIIDKLKKLENKVNNNKSKIKRYRIGKKGD